MLKPRQILKYFIFFFCLVNVIAVCMNIVPTANATVLKQYPSDDAYVYNMNPTTNYGNEISLFVISMGAPPTIVQLSYLKFTVSEFSDASVVKLYFTTGSIEEGYSIKISFELSTTDWSESSVTWNTKPTVPDPFDVIATLWISQSFTQYSINIKDYIAGDIISIAVDPYYSADTKGLVQICSKEVGMVDWRPYISDDGTSSPPLDLTLLWVAIGLIAIAGIGIGVLIYFKRNRITHSSVVPAQTISTALPSSVIPMQRFCIFCGNEIEQDATFCIHCGRQQNGR